VPSTPRPFAAPVSFKALLLRDELTELWLARDLSTGQMGLWRQIRPGTNARAAVEAIDREKAALRQIAGEGVPRIVEAEQGTASALETTFLTADLAWTGAIRLVDSISRRPLAAQRIAWLLRLVAETAEQVAQAGWQHGRLGVDRILLTADHRLLLFDFAFARPLARDLAAESVDRRDFRRLAARLIVGLPALAEQVASAVDLRQALSLVRQARPDLPLPWLVEVLPLVVRPTANELEAGTQAVADWTRLVATCVGLELMGLRGGVWRTAA
jgi:hypothetical protein